MPRPAAGSTVVIGPAEGHEHDATVVLLHGYGLDPSDMRPCARKWSKDHSGLRIVIPAAPIVKRDKKEVFRAWWKVEDSDWEDAHAWGSPRARSGYTESLDRINEIVNEEQAKEVPVILSGFSQGGQVAVAAGITHAQQGDPVAGVVAIAPAPLLRRATSKAPPRRRRFPVSLVWGKDETWDQNAANRWARRLEELQMEVDRSPLPQGVHEVTPEMSDVASAKIKKMLRKANAAKRAAARQQAATRRLAAPSARVTGRVRARSSSRPAVMLPSPEPTEVPSAKRRRQG
eukprot:TRINITY_DN6993_c0_g2_i1.p1 TRINITY_DN6993_c0_g2~~TRINITY_DN6993_c0_g2_i1.p1  ORF type:complete len:288 (+),score=69.68 TRINITY_DN6993_c0_g2_i1:111-974(+)